MERQELFDALGGALSHIAPSDRAFSRHENSLLGVVYGAERKGVVTTTFRSGFQGFLIANLTGARCSPSIERLKKTEAGLLAAVAVEFNGLAASLNRRGIELALIPPEKMRPERDAGRWDDGDFWTSPRSKKVLEDLRWLNHGNRDLPDDRRFWTVEERGSTEWTGRYQELQKRIEGWRVEEEPDPVDHFCMQSHALLAAAQLVPPGPAKTLALRRWLTHFEQGYQPEHVVWRSKAGVALQQSNAQWHERA